jgi:putative DNA primase/helicase
MFSYLSLIKNILMKDVLKNIAFSKKFKTVEDPLERVILDGLIKSKSKQVVVKIIKHVVDVANVEGLGLCKLNQTAFVFNGKFWEEISNKEIMDFLSLAALELGVDSSLAEYFQFKETLLKQFLSLPDENALKNRNKKTLINFKNGTYEYEDYKIIFRSHSKKDYLTYILSFDYDYNARCPLFNEYLEYVIPDENARLVLAEYIAYCFLSHKQLNLEKVLLLLGSGANGKSVFFDIVSALFGKENITNFSIQSLTNDTSYSRAKIENKLVNYASEISSKLNTTVFKQLVSGEPVEVRLPYGEPYIIETYAKMIFNCNELPNDVEQNNAFFRRPLIVPFTVEIPEEKRDIKLSKKIISTELPGIFNWVLCGLDRITLNKTFSRSSLIDNAIQQYKIESDNVQLFLNEEGYKSDIQNHISLKSFYDAYKRFINESGHRAVALRKFSERLKKLGFEITRMSHGNEVYVIKSF